MHWQMVEKIQKEKPDIWLRIVKGFEIIGKMADFAEKTTKAIGVVQKAIGYFSGDNPNPPMLPPG